MRGPRRMGRRTRVRRAGDGTGSEPRGCAGCGGCRRTRAEDGAGGPVLSAQQRVARLEEYRQVLLAELERTESALAAVGVVPGEARCERP